MRKVFLTAYATGLTVLAAQSEGAIVVDGSFADWASVPAIATSIDNGISGSPDFAALKAANDDTYIYLYYQLHRAENPQAGSGVYLSIDADNNPSTGFNVHSLGVIGSEAAWQNDFPFEQGTANFNTGAGLSNATFGAAPYAAATTEVEIRIPIIATRNSDNAALFAPNSTVGIIFYTDGANLDWVVGQYAVVPEPASVAMLGLGSLLLKRRRRGA